MDKDSRLADPVLEFDRTVLVAQVAQGAAPLQGQATSRSWPPPFNQKLGKIANLLLNLRGQLWHQFF